MKRVALVDGIAVLFFLGVAAVWFAVFAVPVAMITCSTVFVFARMVSRAGVVKKVLLDDYFMLVAWVSLQQGTDLPSHVAD